MKYKLGAAAAAAAIAVSTQVVGATSASASVTYELKNVATGKCLTANNTAPLPRALTMKTCGSLSSGEWQSFSPAGTSIELGTKIGTLACLMVPSNASSDFASTPVLNTCLASGYKKLTYNAVNSSSLILNGCYLGDYASGDTYASCFSSSGNNTKWNWVPY